MHEIRCKSCHRKPHEIEEYQQMVEDELYHTAEEAVVLGDGTYNPNTGEFYCTECYIINGMPLGKA